MNSGRPALRKRRSYAAMSSIRPVFERVARMDSGSARPAGCARAAQDDLVGLDLAAEAAREVADRALEPLVGERGDVAALVADDVVVVLAARQQRLVRRAARARVDAAHQLQV